MSGPPPDPAAPGSAATAGGTLDRLRTRVAQVGRRAQRALEAARARSRLVDATVLAFERDRSMAGNVSTPRSGSSGTSALTAAG